MLGSLLHSHSCKEGQELGQWHKSGKQEFSQIGKPQIEPQLCGVLSRGSYVKSRITPLLESSLCNPSACDSNLSPEQHPSFRTTQATAGASARRPKLRGLTNMGASLDTEAYTEAIIHVQKGSTTFMVRTWSPRS